MPAAIDKWLANLNNRAPEILCVSAGQLSMLLANTALNEARIYRGEATVVTKPTLSAQAQVGTYMMPTSVNSDHCA
ncbi:hypothetical protein OAG89_00985 [Pseudomonadales bacterium]|nr:hypothetical protein [Pseudomonadales bacterium]MDB4806546.1 hypothetical protein [Pseudomonadales bacterium]